MKFGTWLEVEGFGPATVVYHGLDGYGVIEGHQEFDSSTEEEANKMNTLFGDDTRSMIVPQPTAMLREPSLERILKMPCIGENYEQIFNVAD
jgi:hypothetical protein